MDMAKMDAGSAAKPVVRYVYLGRQNYDAIHQMQLDLVTLRYKDEIIDTLLLLEHEPVITLGRRGDDGHILADARHLAREGIVVRRVERGGDVTYHGPGQIVGYPILHLREYGLGASDYMHRLEQVIIDTCADFGLYAGRREGYIGVWIGRNKIAAFGVRIRHGVTFHGWALNVAPDMSHWDSIVPCGITDGGVTSLAVELGQAPSMPAVIERLVTHFGRLFGTDLRPTDVDEVFARNNTYSEEQ